MGRKTLARPPSSVAHGAARGHSRNSRHRTPILLKYIKYSFSDRCRDPPDLRTAVGPDESAHLHEPMIGASALTCVHRSRSSRTRTAGALTCTTHKHPLPV